jgi:hypothetical protein
MARPMIVKMVIWHIAPSIRLGSGVSLSCVSNVARSSSMELDARDGGSILARGIDSDDEECVIRHTNLFVGNNQGKARE